LVVTAVTAVMCFYYGQGSALEPERYSCGKSSLSCQNDLSSEIWGELSGKFC